MARVRIVLSLTLRDSLRLIQAALHERTEPATLAARFVSEALAQTADDTDARGPFLALSDWLAPQLDTIRHQGEWNSDITVSVFELIEKEAFELYTAAEVELGRTALNQSIARMVRTRLGAEIIRRNRQPHVARVPKSRTTFIKTYTLLKPAKD